MHEPVVAYIVGVVVGWSVCYLLHVAGR